jgi:cytochrome c biogenesis protein CcdA
MLLLLASALALGMLHTVAPDHLAAVSVFVSRRPGWRRAVGYGARWGLGHSITIVAVGGVVVLSQLRLPAHFEGSVDRAVGIVMILLGANALRRAWRHWLHQRAHLSGHGHPAHHHDDGALVGIGMLHGLAGSGALAVALPVTATQSTLGSIGYLAAFGAGTVLAMSVLAATLGAAVHRASAQSARWAVGAMTLAATASIGVGAWWVVR